MVGILRLRHLTVAASRFFSNFSIELFLRASRERNYQFPIPALSPFKLNVKNGNRYFPFDNRHLYIR